MGGHRGRPRPPRVDRRQVRRRGQPLGRRRRRVHRHVCARDLRHHPGRPAEVPLPRPLLPRRPADLADHLHDRDVVYELRRRPHGDQRGVGQVPHRPVGQGGRGGAAIRDVGRGADGRGRHHGHHHAPAHRPQGRRDVCRYAGRPRADHRRGREEPDRQGHQGQRLHDPQRPRGQRPLRGPVGARRADRGGRHQDFRALGGVRRQGVDAIRRRR